MSKMRAALCGIAGLLAVSAASAGSLEVAPTTIEFQPGSQNAVLYVINHGDRPSAIQIETFDWHQTDGSDRLDRSDVLMASPPMARLLPGQRQTIRLALSQLPAGADERSFRILVDELPDPQADDAHQGVRVLLRLSVPVFAAGAPGDSKLVWNAARAKDGVALTVENAGTHRAKLANLALAAPEGPRVTVSPDAFAYVLPHASRRWTVDGKALATSVALDIEGIDENGDVPIHSTVPLVP